MKKIFSIIFGIFFIVSISLLNVYAADPFAVPRSEFSSPSSVLPTINAPSTLQGTVTGNPSTINGSDQNKIPNPLGGSVNSLPAFFSAIISVVIELGTIVAVLAIMYGGFLYVTAQGDEEKLGKAYKTLTWAIVGTAILLGARTIMAVVTDTVKQLGSGI